MSEDKPKKRWGVVARHWWKDMQPDGNRPDPAALAMLRRASTPVEALMLPATVRLHDLLQEAGWSGANKRKWLGVLAATLAHVRADRPEIPMARLLGPPSPGAAPVLSPLRFQRLMAAEGEEELMIQFRRIVAIADRTANIADLAESILNWDEDRKVRWVFAYWGDRMPGIEAAQHESEEA